MIEVFKKGHRIFHESSSITVHPTGAFPYFPSSQVSTIFLVKIITVQPSLAAV